MKTINTMKNNIELRAGKNLVESWLLRGIYLLSTLFILSVGQSWALDIYLDISAADWPKDGATIKLYPGTGSDVTGTSVATNLYKFSVSSATGTMWFKRMSGSDTWNQGSVTYNASYNLYKLTDWNAVACSGANINTVTKSNYIYFVNNIGWTDAYKYFVIGHDQPTKYSKVYSMSPIAHTQLLYVANTTDNWPDATYYGFCGTSSSWGNGDWGSDNLSNATKYTGTITAKKDLASNKYYLFDTGGNASNGATLLMSNAKTSYTDAIFKTTLTGYRYVLATGETNFASSSNNSIGTVSISGYTWSDKNAANTVASASLGSNASASITPAITSEITLTAEPGAGYTFAGWYTSAPTTLAASTPISTDLTYTYNIGILTSGYRVYAGFIQETSHDVTISEFCTTTSSTISSDTRAIGEMTYAAITAPEIYGYTFVNWTKGTGLDLKSGDALTNATIHVKTLSSGTYTLQANYTEDLSSPWYVAGESSDIFGGWGGSGRNMQRKTGHSAEKRFYYTIDATKVINGDVSDSDLEFKIYNNSNDTYRGNSGYWVTRANYQPELSSSSGSNMQFRPDAYGEYEFKLDCESPYSESAPKLTVTFLPKCSVAVTRATAGGSIAMEYKGNTLNNTLDYVIEGSNVTFSTVVDSRYTFDGWYKRGNDTRLSTNTTYTRTISESPIVMVATFIEKKYNVTVTANPASGGSVTPTEVTLMGQANGGSITASANTGYSFTNWTITSGTGYFGASGTATTSTNANTKFRPTAAATIRANFTAHTYTVSYNANGGTGTTANSSHTYDVAKALTSNGYSKTGYNFGGWATSKANADAGTVAYTNGQSVTNLSSTQGATVTLWAIWTPKQSAITLDKQTSAEGYGGNAGTVSTSPGSASYGAAMPTLSGTMPTAANGYAFMGFFTETNGNGTKYYNADGTSARNWDVDTESGTTLYAYYQKAGITALTFDAAAYEPGGTVGVTPTVYPMPTGTTVICWRVLHSNGNPLDPQPTITYNPSSPGAKVTFPAEATSGTYKVEAKLHLDDCDGTQLGATQVRNFQVAGSHTVTVLYKDGEGNTLQASTSVVATPLAWSSAITAPSIFGYTFDHWKARDGITLSEDGSSELGSDESDEETIYIKAIYNGSLTAVYSQNDIIYFKNTLGWSSVYVNLYSSSYWNNPNGSGNNGVTNSNIAMTRIGETDVWYYDYGAESITPSKYVSFTSSSQVNAENFWGSGSGINVVYPVNNADNIHTAKPDDNGFYAKTPMFVPLAGQTAVVLNNSGGGKANYYNRGYWTKYTPGTGYILKVYNNAGDALLKSISFTSSDDLMPMTAVADLEGNTNYKYELMREGDVYYGNDGTMNYTNHGQGTPWEMSWKSGGHKCGLTSTAAGEYTFHLTYSANASSQYRLRMAVDYPIADGDYRVIYKDNVHTLWHPSAIVSKVNNKKDTVSFFIRPGQTPVMKIQQASVDGSGAITWNDYDDDIATSAGLSSLPQDSVYNICLQMNGSGAISVENVEAYTGDFYIRVDAANNKWDNYKNADHAMTYSEYSDKNSDYTHYWMAHTWKNDNTNIKFVIANDYSPCISDTMIRSNYRGSDADFVDEYGVITPEANIRFMWNRSDNTINRAYLSPAKKDGSQFLVLRGTTSNNLLSESGSVLDGEPGETGTNNHAGGDHCMQFTDNENWIYEAMVKVQPNTFVKLFARFAKTLDANDLPATYTDFYYKGKDNATFDKDNAITLITGSGDHLLVRVIYDFKTDRLLAAYIPSGNITTEMNINADVMFIREHQGDITQITFSDGGAIKQIKSAYAVMRFNKWTLNNKNKDTHSPLTSPLSRYERDIFYVSFPFRVNLNEVFGFGTYGVHWIMEEYDGAGRAEKGFWKDSKTFWKFITNRQGKYLEPNVGYILALDLDELGEDAAVWGVAENERAELFFPSTTDLPDITTGTVTHELPAHLCTINRPTEHGDRRIADSHWNIMSVPTYVNTDNLSFTNSLWETGEPNKETGYPGPNFLYTWNSDDNSLTPTSASGFTYHAMHAYTVQYCGNVTWRTTSVSPSAIVARERRAPNAYEWCLEIQQDSLMIDRTYVRMTDEEEVTTGFEFGYDMSKDLNKNRAGIYSFITTAESTEMAAGNCLPLETEQTTLVPLGVSIPTTGDYTFAMPAGTSGVGVTLIDNDANVRTNLSALDYTVNLTAGDYTNRFFLEIPPVQPIHTDLEPTSDSSLKGRAQKKIIDGLLYIVRDGKMYDARGARVE